MAFKTRLLTTAAIPLIALMGMGPAFAVELPRQVAPVEAQSLLLKVQADPDADELLKQQQRQERRENRRKNAEQQDGQDDNGGQRRNRQKASQDEMQQDEQQQPRRKRQQDAAQQSDDLNQSIEQNNRKRRQQNEQQAEQPVDQGNAADDSQAETPRKHKNRKNQSADQETTPASNSQAESTGQSEDELRKAVEDNNKRKKRDKNQADQATDDNGSADDNGQQNNRRKKNQAADQATDENGNADNGLNNRRKKNQSADQETAPASDNQNASQSSDQSDDQLKKALEENNKKRRKNNQNADQATDDNGNADDNGQNNRRKKNQNADQASDDNGNNRNDQKPVDVKKAKDIAADPSKTTDTVVLPVENGAAVLDSDKDADRSGQNRERRKREREEVKQVEVPKSDKDAQRGFREDNTRIVIKPVLETRGEQIRDFRGYEDVGGRRVGDRDNRVVIEVGGKLVIRSDDDRRLADNQKISYERLPNGMVREVVIRSDGDKVVTVRNRYGEIVRRSRIDRSDREVVIFYSPVLERGRERLFLRDPGADLPPMRLTIPVNDYIVDVSGSGGKRNFEEFLDEPPVERVERVYTVDEVKNSARIRDKMRRIDLDTITFETGSAEIDEDQVQSLKRVGQAIKNILDKDPGETFLIEGHTDAVGSDESNLVLSDSRAESVAQVLSDAFDIPAENLVTQGYGERYLKVNTDSAERANRRVTIRRITPLVRPLEAAQQ